MSVFADILVLAALIAAAWLGARRGLLKSLAGLPPDGACGPVDRAPGDPAGGAEN